MTVNPSFEEFTSALRQLPASRPHHLRAISLVVGSFVLFVLFSLWWFERMWSIAITVSAAVLLHEGGHYLGLRVFGYCNIRMLFLPPFGAGVVGTKQAAPAWQEAVMVLLGPLPGIALAVLVSLFFPSDYVVHSVSQIDWQLIAMFDLVSTLVILNAFNLLPLLPMDGGRLIAVLLLGRAPRLAVSFVAVSMVLLIPLAYVARAWILLGIGVFGLFAMPWTIQRESLVVAVRSRIKGFPEDLSALDRRKTRMLFWLARKLSTGKQDAQELAEEARWIHNQIVKPPLSTPAALGVSTAYAAAVVAAFLASSNIPDTSIVP
jgi:Zn-dependent protease